MCVCVTVVSVDVLRERGGGGAVCVRVCVTVVSVDGLKETDRGGRRREEREREDSA